MDFNVLFPSDNDKIQLIQIYHKFKDEKDKYVLIFGEIERQFNIVIEPKDKERFRCWLKKVRKNLDDNYQPIKTDLSEELQDKLNQIRLEKLKVQEEKRQLNKYYYAMARTELLKEYIEEEIQKLNQSKPLYVPKLKEQDVLTERVFVLLLSDLHYAQILKPKAVYPLENKFNPEVFKQRMNELANQLIIRGKQFGINRLYIFSLGDEIEGDNIFTNQALNISDVVIQQLIQYSEFMSEWITELSKHFKITFYNALGNHTRTTRKAKDALNDNNYSLLAQYIIKLRLENCENVEVVWNENEFVITDILGYAFLGIHGHQINNDLSYILQQYSTMFNTLFDFVLVGHFHSPFEKNIHGKEVLGNGSLVGINDYSLRIKKTSPPCQKLFILDEQIGRDCTWNIRLD